MARRTFLKLLGAGAGLAGLTGCTGDLPGTIVPYVDRPPELTPGIPLHYATSLVLDGYATGVLVRANEGRPTKIEGNPDHPASLGAAGVHEQAAILELYDPHRARTVRAGNEPRSFAGFRRSWQAPERLHLLLEPTSSPLVASLLARIRARHADAQIHFHAPLATRAAFEASRALLGRPLAPRLELDRATTILALDSDFLAAGPFHLAHARAFAARRSPAAAMHRLYVVEPAPTPTGMAADHRLAPRPSELPRLLAGILAEVVRALGTEVPEAVRGLLSKTRPEPFAKACAKDLAANRGASAVLVGERQPRAVHALAVLLNDALDARVSYAEPALLEAGEPSHGLDALARALDRGEVSDLVILGGNPVYSAPADMAFGALVGRAKRSAHLGLHENETGEACTWFLPAAHPLESWGDARAYDGTVSHIQPLLEPLYSGKTVAEVLGCFTGEGERTAREHLLAFTGTLTGDRDGYLERSLAAGLVAGSALPAARVRARWDAAAPAIAPALEGDGVGGLELAFARDAAVHDGRFANNAWLLELPDPVTKLTWDKAALVSPETARALGVSTEDVVTIGLADRALEAPVFVLPGHADGVVTLPLGYGRDGSEALARGVGFSAYRLTTRAAPFFAAHARVERIEDATSAIPGTAPALAARRHPLASTQLHGVIQGETILEQATLAEYEKNPTFAKEPTRLALYEPTPATGNQWGMTIDLGKCTGCNACVVGCQAENNTPVVGKDDVIRGREMHWLRIDRYFQESAPGFALQPMLCQHCEEAPCEYVCPVNATTHSPDGLNEMTYNRCVGTRFCSNNCAWKVRRFNWFNYQGEKTPVERLAMNPDVTVRERGVMEKCTFCVQRIRGAEIQAALEGRAIRDGELLTACQQACPSRAIVFGNLADPGSRVVHERKDPRLYACLGELGTRPRVNYLARITNPNPELAP
jgi:molybdopterin-containing oxidoreductase family iron-sulfur binding subunit